MKTIPALLLLSLVSFTSAFGQTTPPTTAELIEQALATFDLPPFGWSGDPEPARPRLGMYFNPIPPDSVALVTGKAKNDPWFVVWHVMPHWSADEGGILIGDTLTAINGRAIGDSTHSGPDFVDLMVREMKRGDVVRLKVRRNGADREIRVPLLTFERVPMAYTMPSELGPIRGSSWLRQRLEENDLTAWSLEIAKQMRLISDIDFGRVPFAGRPNPWRLNAITTLHNNPMRTGVYGRLIVSDLWRETDAGPGLAGAVRAAATHLDIPLARQSDPPSVSTQDELTKYLTSVQASLDEAYRPVLSDLNVVASDLVALLDPDANWESELDSIADPVQKRNARNAEEDRIARLFTRADEVRFRDLVDGAAQLAGLIDTARLKSFGEQFRWFAGRLPTHIHGVEGDVIHSWQTPLGLCVIGGPGPNRYTASFPFIMDLGGNDHYELPPAPAGTARFVADLAGEDVYLSTASSQGAGIGSVDMLVDVAGDDTYRADHAAQGAGVLGIGLLADMAGNDVYTSHWFSQGAGFLGIGLIYEGGGSDNYSADIYAQAFGYAKGFGGVLERAGNDSYRAGWAHEDWRYPNRAHIAMSQGFGFGMRPWSVGIGTDGGIGALTDRDGDDVYASDFFSQGGSYWYAFGILHDGAGADRYTAGQYSQGSGIHLSFGALLDDAGDDMYDAYHGLEQGNAHDWSAGCLEDLSGNDTYRGSTTSQGVAVNVAFGWLLDRAGNDLYYVLPSDTVSNQGGTNFNAPRKHGALGMLLDLGNGTDYYTDSRATPGTLIVKGERGILFDEGKP